MSDDSQKLATGESLPPAIGEGEQLASSSQEKSPGRDNPAADGDAGATPSELAADNQADALARQSFDDAAQGGEDATRGEDARELVGEDAEEPEEDEPEEDEDVEDVEPLELISEEDDVTMGWYILKVQSNRERSIAASLKRKVAIEGLDRYFGDILVPTEKVTEFKGGKKKIVERKLYPGYIVVQMHINDDTWFAVRETSGIGDFTGAGGKPTPMLAHEVARIVQAEEEETDEAPKLDIKFKQEDKVKVKEGTFEGFEGNVSAIDEQSGKITVMINIFGRSTPVELEYWQVEGV